MNSNADCCEKTEAARFPVLEVALLIGLPVAVLVAGGITVAVAFGSGFTPEQYPAAAAPAAEAPQH